MNHWCPVNNHVKFVIPAKAGIQAVTFRRRKRTFWIPSAVLFDNEDNASTVPSIMKSLKRDDGMTVLLFPVGVSPDATDLEYIIGAHDKNIRDLFKTIRRLMSLSKKSVRPIGFRSKS